MEFLTKDVAASKLHGAGGGAEKPVYILDSSIFLKMKAVAESYDVFLHTAGLVVEFLDEQQTIHANIRQVGMAVYCVLQCVAVCCSVLQSGRAADYPRQ